MPVFRAENFIRKKRDRAQLSADEIWQFAEGGRDGSVAEFAMNDKCAAGTGTGTPASKIPPLVIVISRTASLPA